MASFPQVSPLETCAQLFSPSCVPHASPTSLLSILRERCYPYVHKLNQLIFEKDLNHISCVSSLCGIFSLYFEISRNLFIYLLQDFSQNTNASPRKTSSTFSAGNIIINSVYTYQLHIYNFTSRNKCDTVTE